MKHDFLFLESDILMPIIARDQIASVNQTPNPKSDYKIFIKTKDGDTVFTRMSLDQIMDQLKEVMIYE